jgi:hypothetical protein
MGNFVDDLVERLRKNNPSIYSEGNLDNEEGVLFLGKSQIVIKLKRPYLRREIGELFNVIIKLEDKFIIYSNRKDYEDEILSYFREKGIDFQHHNLYKVSFKG